MTVAPQPLLCCCLPLPRPSFSSVHSGHPNHRRPHPHHLKGIMWSAVLQNHRVNGFQGDMTQVSLASGMGL